VRHDWFVASGGGLLSTLWLANPLTVMLLKPTFVPNIDTQKLYADISAQELAAGGGYTVGGQLLASKTANYDAAQDRTNLLSADSIWSAATFDTAYAAIYDNSGSKPLWSLVDFEGIKNVAGGVFTIDWATVGNLYVTKA